MVQLDRSLLEISHYQLPKKKAHTFIRGVKKNSRYKHQSKIYLYHYLGGSRQQMTAIVKKNLALSDFDIFI